MRLRGYVPSTPGLNFDTFNFLFSDTGTMNGSNRNEVQMHNYFDIGRGQSVVENQGYPQDAFSSRVS